MSHDNPIAKLGDLTKPATVLIEKISEAVGGVFKPFQIVRVARAEAAAAKVQAEMQIQITDLHRRAMHRFLEEEATKQANIEAITQQAIPLLEEKSSPQGMTNDWIANFFDKSRIVSDSDMQSLWARVLAGEANAPGAYSKRTVNLLGDLENHDAELFIALCGFTWKLGILTPMIFATDDPIYNAHGIHFNALSHLESLGLIKFDWMAGFARLKLPKFATATYFDEPVHFEFPLERDNTLEIGHVLLTRAGQELATICQAKPVDGFVDYVRNRWKAKNIVKDSAQKQMRCGAASRDQ